MSNFFNMDIINTHWFTYGIALVIGTPILIISINEVIYILKKKENQLASPLRNIRNIIIPFTALIIFFTQIAEVGNDSSILKILETVTWIVTINILMVFLNMILFSKSGILKNKTPQLFLDIFRIVMVLFGTAIILSVVWDQNLGGLITALGLGSFVLGLALQDTLGNLFSGIALVYEKPFNEGDWIKIGNHVGKIVEMNWRAIRLQTREKELIIIPHLVIGQESIINCSKPEKIYILKKVIGFSYDTAPNNVKEALMETCKSTPGILHSSPIQIKVCEYGDSSINYEVEFGIQDYTYREEIMDDFMTRVWYAVRRYDLNIPFPQLTIHDVKDISQKNTVKEENINSILNHLPELIPIDKTQAKNLKGGAEIHYFGRGEIILDEDDETGYLFIILDGKASLSGTNNDGDKVSVGVLEVGDFFGEIALFTSNSSSFKVMAITDITVITISPPKVHELVENNSKFAYYLDEIMDIRRDIKNKKSYQES